MRVLRVFFLGLVYGWLMRWIIDVIFLEDNLRILKIENGLLKQRIQTLEATRSLGTGPVQRALPASLPVEELPPVPANESGPIVPHRDDLKLIKGVGPQIEKKLNNAGVHTFDQMSRLTTAELQAILGINKRVVQSADNLISQAKKFAEQGPKG